MRLLTQLRDQGSLAWGVGNIPGAVCVGNNKTRGPSYIPVIERT
jgi:hypothetical protein